jgi:hypothetical protein
VARVVGALFVVVPPVSIIAFGAIYQGMGYMALLAMPVLFFHLLGFGILLRNFDKRDGMKKSARIAGSTLAIILMGVGVLITTGIGFFLELPYYIILLSVISFPVVVLFTILMRRRTKKGAEWMGKILGFLSCITLCVCLWFDQPMVEKI